MPPASDNPKSRRRRASPHAASIASLAAAVFATALSNTPVLAQQAAPSSETQDQPDWQARHGDGSEPPSDIWHRDTLSGDWNGARTDLESKGISFSLTYTSDLQGNLLGGIRTGGVYDGLLELEIDLDLEKILAWQGATARLSAIVASGPSLSATYVGNLLNTSSINARPATRLYNAWLQQNLSDDRVSLRAGLMTADAEFFVSPTAGLFINSSFGWPGILALDLPGGGPAYPLPAPGVRLKLQPMPEFSLQVGIFSGDPTGNDGSNSLSTQQPSGTVISFDGGVLMMAEAAYSTSLGKGEDKLPATLKLGGWYHTSSRFGDQRFDTDGRSRADPSSNGMPGLHDGDWGLYGIVDAMVYRELGTHNQGLSVFARLAGAPQDRNLIGLYADAGLSYKGLLPARDDDIAGIAVAYAPISKGARDLDMDSRAFGGTNPVRSAETVFELTYQAAVTPWWSLQADIQYLIDPGGGVVNDDGSVRGDSLVLGLRSAVTF